MLKENAAIQAAHDIFHAVILGECPAPMSHVDKLCLRSAHDALAWVLGCPCGDATDENIRKILKWAFDNDFKMVREKS